MTDDKIQTTGTKASAVQADAPAAQFGDHVHGVECISRHTKLLSAGLSVHQRAIPLHLPDAGIPLPELLQFLRLLLS